MEAPSLAKLSRPRLYDAVPRERLFRRLDECRPHPCIWVCGPPGSGKTTLVEGWLRARDLESIWYQLDGGDRDLSTFFYYLAEAVRPFAGQFPALPLLTPEYLTDLPGFGRRFFRELFARLPAGSVWVVDNHHESLGSEAFQYLLTLAVRELPHRNNLIVVSRSMPPTAFIEHEAKRDLVCLLPEELKLTAEEGQAIARQSGVVDSEVSRKLLELSGGWAAGLVLMLQRQRRGLPEEVETQSLNAVFDYFASQYFADAPDEVRLALMKLSCVSSFTLETAREITGQARIDRVVNALCAQQFFTYQKAAEPIRFAFHDLFREFLARQARQQLTSDELRGVRVRAARRLEHEGQAEEAFDLFFSAADYGAALRVALEAAPRLLGQGRWQTLETWIRAIPVEARASNAWAAYWLGLACIPRDQALAEAELAHAHALFETDGDRVGRVLAASAIAESRYLSMSNWAPIHPWLDLLDSMLGGDDRWFPDALKAQVYPPMAAGLMMSVPSHPRLNSYVERAAAALKDAASDTQRVMGAALTLNVCSVRGQHELAAALIAQHDLAVEVPGASPIANAALRAQLGFHCALIGQLEQAVDHCETALAIGAEHGFERLLQLALVYRFIAEMSRHNHPVLRRLLDRMQALLIPGRHIDAATIHLLELWLDAAMQPNRVDSARLQAVRESGCETGSQLYVFIFHTLLATIAAERGDLRDARTYLAVAHEIHAEGGLDCFAAMLDFATARIEQLDGNAHAAVDRLHTAFASIRCHPSHAAFALWLAPPTMSRSMVFALEQRLSAQEVCRLIDMLRLVAPRDAPADWPWPIRIWCLGTFRVEVRGAPLAFAHKVPKRTLAFLKALIAHGGRNVPLTRIADDLWPDKDGDSAMEAAKITLHRLRKLFSTGEALKLENGHLSLDAQWVWVDALALDAADGTQALALYKGVFLPNDEDEVWSFRARERLRARFCRALLGEHSRAMKSGEHFDAHATVARIEKSDPSGLRLYRALGAALSESACSVDADALLRSVSHGVTL